MIESFPAQVTDNCQTLILGSIPGVESLQQQQYYAHPRNAFWPIMGDIFNIDIEQNYQEKLAALNAANIGLWDVLQSCQRDGSLDSNIASDSVAANNFNLLFSEQPQLSTVLLNGGAAFKWFEKLVLPSLKMTINIQKLPSTSPAYAAMPYSDKLELWRKALMPLQ